jgi:hypothetical protein
MRHDDFNEGFSPDTRSAVRKWPARLFPPITQSVQEISMQYIPSRHWYTLLGVISTIVQLGLAPAQAATSGEVAPLGFAIGKATRGLVVEGLKGKTKLTDEGVNRYSRGVMLEGPGEGLGIDDLSEVLFVFDAQDNLVGLRMTFPKGPMDHGFENLLGYLSAKYPLVSKQIPFVGDNSARLQQGDVAIEVYAPHLSFTMTVLYMTTGFEQAIEAGLRQEAESKKKRESSQF